MKYFLFIFSVVFLASPALAQELVTDGGFEVDGSIGIHWEFVWGQYPSNSSVIQSSEQAHSGTYSCKIVTDAGTTWPDYTGIMQDINPADNTEYVMTFWFKGVIPHVTDGEVEAKASGSTQHDAMGIDSKNNTSPIQSDDGEFIINPGTYNNWTKVNYYWNSRSGYGDFQIDIGSYNNTGDTYYFDDFSIIPSSQSGISEDFDGVITNFELFQNYPNPFNPSTTIKFAVPHRQNITIDVYNQVGQKVSTILNINTPPGYHEVEFDGKELASGVYFVRMKAGEFQDMKKTILLK